MSEQKPSAMGDEEDGSGIAGFMCLTDYECEVGFANGGNAVYPSIENLKRHRPCVDSCGIVEVRVVGVRIVQPARRDWGADDE